MWLHSFPSQVGMAWERGSRMCMHCLSQIHSRNWRMCINMAMDTAFILEAYASFELQITEFVRTIVHSFTARQLGHINGKGAHSHQCACAENLKWTLDKQHEILRTGPGSDHELEPGPLPYSNTSELLHSWLDFCWWCFQFTW